ncbi:hypothetical protein QE152_g166 [Popillia japonica]|uniref:Uncharacterized protein n=1 Tax=Popillia japonica TaxID=7064 RepID=A0AAW1NMG2_POPJA
MQQVGVNVMNKVIHASRGYRFNDFKEKKNLADDAATSCEYKRFIGTSPKLPSQIARNYQQKNVRANDDPAVYDDELIN